MVEHEDAIVIGLAIGAIVCILGLAYFMITGIAEIFIGLNPALGGA